MTDMIVHIISVAYHRAIPLRILIDSFLVQTNPNWRLYIIHDGPPPPAVQSVISSYNDLRIQFTSTPTVKGNWGHPNRKFMLGQIPLNHRDFVLMTNDDNYYVPTFIEQMLKECRKYDVGFVYCDTLHSYLKYDVLSTEVREGSIDMGAFIVKLDVAKHIGFNHMHISADGLYAVECATFCKLRRLKVVKIPKPLFVHN